VHHSMFRAVVFCAALWCLAPACIRAQVFDNFGDGNFSQNPPWAGNDSFFTASPGLLRYTGPARTNTAYLSTAFVRNLASGITEWEFDLQLSFQQLDNLNELRLYLTADLRVLNNSSAGYFLQFGGVGNETRLRFIRQVGGILNAISQTPTGTIAPNGSYRIRIVRTADGISTIFLNGTPVCTASENGLTTSAALGVYIRHQSQNNEAFALRLVSARTLPPDRQPPQLQGVQNSASDTLVAVFDEAVRAADAGLPTRYRLDGVLIPTTARALPNNAAAYKLSLPATLVAGQQYTLSFSNVRDIAGNVGAGSFSFRAGDNSLGLPGEVVINEILHEPYSGEARYLELYNASQRRIDLRNWQLGRGTGTTMEKISISTATSVLQPGQYLCLTISPSQVAQTYQAPDSASFLPMLRFPAYDPTSDQITLYRADGQVVDAVLYSNTWHYPDLSDRQGVSLERLSPSLPSNEARSWHSAASTNYYGTPGYQNSQQLGNGTGITIVLPRPDFTPNADGNTDELSIELTTAEPGWKVVISIYSERGFLVRTYAAQTLPTGAETLVWDGRDDRGSALSPGFYVVLAQAAHPATGRQVAEKAACVLALPR
jgi:hypothetical protein